MNRLSIRIADKLRHELQKLGGRSGMSVSDLVRESIRRYVAIERFRLLRKRTLPFAEAQGLLTDKRAFQIVS
jgi:hypothetical protein